MKTHVIITYANGSTSHHPVSSYVDAYQFARQSISYTGGKVKRVEIGEPSGGLRAVWGATWNEESKRAGLTTPD